MHTNTTTPNTHVAVVATLLVAAISVGSATHQRQQAQLLRSDDARLLSLHCAPNTRTFAMHDEMVFAGNDARTYLDITNVGMSRDSITQIEWKLTGNGAHPIHKPDPETVRALAEASSHYLVHFLDIETLRSKLIELYPNVSQDRIDAMRLDIIADYYEAYKSGLSSNPRAVVIAYNQPVSVSRTGRVISDGYHIGGYYLPSKTPEQYVQSLQNRIAALPNDGKPRYVMTSVVSFSQGSHQLIEPKVLDEILNGLTRLPVDGIVFWYKINVNDRIDIVEAVDAYGVLKQAVLKVRNT